MNPKDAYLYEQIIALAQGIEDKDKAVVALLYLAQGLACKTAQERKEDNEAICSHCIFYYWSICHELTEFCQYNGVSNKPEDEKDE